MLCRPYPHALKQFKQSSGVIEAMAVEMALSSVRIVRAAKLRRIAFILEKIFSIGFRSGE